MENTLLDGLQWLALLCAWGVLLIFGGVCIEIATSNTARRWVARLREIERGRRAQAEQISEKRREAHRARLAHQAAWIKSNCHQFDRKD